MDWNINFARKVYGLENYVRENLINVDEDGFLTIYIGDVKIRIKDLMDSYKLEVAYIRILPAIRMSMNLVYGAYKVVAEAVGYSGTLVPVYPLKVNSTPVVVDTIAKYSEKCVWGFNAGSLGEIKILQKVAEKYSPRLIIYDGVVSERILQELLKLTSFGWRVVVDVKSESEVEKLHKYPQLEVGIRIKPVVKMRGKWSDSVGLSSKFGLALNTLDKIAAEFKWLAERATLLHMHPGSQVHRIEDLDRYFDEIVTVYEGLINMGFKDIRMVDPGGGMAYPYIDLKDGSEESPNYTITDYFRALIGKLVKASYKPSIVYEGGRFVVAAHRLVVAKVIDVRPFSSMRSTQVHGRKFDEVKGVKDIKALITRLKTELARLRLRALVNNDDRRLYEDTVSWVMEDLATKVVELVSSGKIDWKTLASDREILKILITPTKRFILNMSIFADIPDAVLVDQYFQVVPAHRLNERPNVLASLSDLTCDSMGEVAKFISPGTLFKGSSPLFTALDNRVIAIPGIKLKLKGVPLHIPSQNENYYVVFLDTGAYQDALAMKHNLIYGAPEIIIDQENNELKIELLKHDNMYT